MVEATSAKLPPRELISFYIADQFFCIDIMAVREIRGWTSATPLPHAPSTSRGVDKPARRQCYRWSIWVALLGLSATAATKQNVIIVVESGGQVVGLLVDGVSDILTLTNEMLQPVPLDRGGCRDLQHRRD